MTNAVRKKTAGKNPPERTAPNISYTVEGHIWIEGKEGTFLSVGRITLLERIKEFGSITRAAKSINMSYRKAWELVESMNRQAYSPLVTASAGGRNGGGATVTEAGQQAIAAFRRLDEGFRRFREDMAQKIAGPVKR